MNANGIGLDIGGANLKAATAGGKARSHPFELWKHPDRLGSALVDLLRGWTPSRLAITMTGELCDCFESKRDGVDRILAQVEQAFPGIPLHIWSTRGVFVAAETARRDPLRVAAANWHALATVATTMGDSLGTNPAVMLLIDVGSTTTDVIPLVNGAPAPAGLTDTERLQSKELVYTGVRRTPICPAPVEEGVMAEWFATTVDAYVLLGLLAEDAGDRFTADGRPTTRKHAHARLARMLGGDSESIAETETLRLAEHVHAIQRGQIVEALRMVVSRLPTAPGAVIVSGSGEWLARQAWSDFAERPLPIRSLGETLGASVSSSACAYAVAILGQDNSSTRGLLPNQ